MAFEILLIGLDRVNTSIGIALKNAQGEVQRIGYDPDKQNARQSESLGAIDQLVSHPRKAIRSADLIIFSLPPGETEVYLENLGQSIKNGAIVMETAAMKTSFFETVRNALPDSVNAIGITPIIGSDELFAFDPELSEPRADLFKEGTLAIVAPPQTSESSLAVAVNLATLLGAEPFFIGLHEHDAAMVASEDLPPLLSAVLMRAATDAPSWRELQRLAGATFAMATELSGKQSPKQFRKRFEPNRAKILAKLDMVSAEIDDLRKLVAEASGEDLERYLEEAERSRHAWLQARKRANWAAEEFDTKAAGEINFFGNLFGLRPRDKGES
ncbi:MAG: prephenate dehydrogenase [Anaerolineales bacterium]|jgi:prephenate dehydrogenase